MLYECELHQVSYDAKNENMKDSSLDSNLGNKKDSNGNDHNKANHNTRDHTMDYTNHNYTNMGSIH